MLIRNASVKEIQTCQNIFSNDSYWKDIMDTHQAIFIEKSPTEPLLSCLQKDEAIKLLEKFHVAFPEGICTFVTEDDISEYTLPMTLENTGLDNIGDFIVPSKRKPVARVAPVVHRINYTPEKTVEVEIDTTTTPTANQKETLELLPLTGTAWEDIHGKTKNVLLRRGWVVVNNRTAEITEVGQKVLAKAKE
jgi:hypothetical protein